MRDDLFEKIIEGDCIDKMQNFRNDTFDLVISDPPYWKVIGEEWDYRWRTETDYVEWSKKWFSEVYRVLRIGGTFYLFGYFRMLLHLVPVLQKIGFDLRQQIIINKGLKAVSGRATKRYKMFPNVTESVLFLVKNNIPYSRMLLKSQQKKLGLTSKEINERLGVKSNGGGMWSIYTGKNICEQFPTKELWEKLCEILKIDIQYERISQTYNPQMGLTDVWEDIDFYKEKRYHPTQKPISLLKRLIYASSNRGDKILDPFAGSGNTYFASLELGRDCTLIEQDPKYVQTIKNRIDDFNADFFKHY